MQATFSGKTLLIRADGNDHIGYGHLMRCFAIAQKYIQQGGRVVLLAAPEYTVIENRIIQAGITVVHLEAKPGSETDILETLGNSEKFNADWIILDGYHFHASFHHRLKNADKKVLLIDDHGALDYYSADLILNQNIYASANMYNSKLSKDSLLMAGCKFCCLRNEFQEWIDWKRPKINNARKIIISLGGSVHESAILKVVRALKLLNRHEFNVTVVTGVSDSYLSSLNKLAKNCLFDIEILTNAQDMADLISASDVAISAGGSTCLELAFMGLPSLIIVMADNQKQLASSLTDFGIAKNLGWHKSLSEIDIKNHILDLIDNLDELQKMSSLGQRFVDGKGVLRVIHQMRIVD